jgi:hypothetical protein
MLFKALTIIALLLFSFSCKKSTSYQIVLFNDSVEQLKVKVYTSKLALSKDSVILNPSQEYEIYFKEEDGINSSYQCKMLLDSVICYSPKHKLKINATSSALWQYSEMPSKYKEQHKCSLAIGAGDTIQ